MIEALACGTPIAAFPVQGPADVLDQTCGALDEDLDRAIARALTLEREDCIAHGRRFSWQASADQFLAALACEEPAALPKRKLIGRRPQLVQRGSRQTNPVRPAAVPATQPRQGARHS
jgi:hypothetical protein